MYQRTPKLRQKYAGGMGVRIVWLLAMTFNIADKSTCRAYTTA